ncbi:hypothetical protein C2845_PM05G18980 [Panicum miliaceum]|uniref:F-box domain-containing protein n=1 Tax=Panicum miliaceum TaxID=4540 RepID=A0A3L6SXC3_PANMI|nr:hypothetical protein C2845_PM05G18980 [Panicum miliaceum]
MAPGTSRLKVNYDIPEDVLCENIFSRLPFKLVTCLKIVSKHCLLQITNNIKFATKQARLCPSCPALIQISFLVNSDGRYDYYLNVISSTPTIIGVPSSRLGFLATQQAQPIPGAAQHLIQGRAVGLVFDPPNEPSSIEEHKIDQPKEQFSAKENKFKIVQAIPIKNTSYTTIGFRFVIFSSDTGRWVMSNTIVNANIKEDECDKVVYASGVLYWDYQDNLLWFDVSRSSGGIIKMRWMLQGSKSEKWDHHSIDTSINNVLVCTTITKDGLAIYRLVEGGVHYWELMHKKEWKSIMEVSGDAFQFYHSMKLRNCWQSKFCERWLVRPFGLESGRWLYLGVSEKWDTLEKVLLCDLESGKMEDLGRDLSDQFNLTSIFGYRNSMAALPPIAVPPLQGGICDGNPGGCICALK